MTVTNAPLIVSSRFEQTDGHTLAGYQRTGPDPRARPLSMSSGGGHQPA